MKFKTKIKQLKGAVLLANVKRKDITNNILPETKQTLNDIDDLQNDPSMHSLVREETQLTNEKLIQTKQDLKGIETIYEKGVKALNTNQSEKVITAILDELISDWPDLVPYYE